MPSLFLRRMSEEERNDLVQRLHSTQNGRCFICEKPIDMDIHAGHVEIDHIEPIVGGGKDAPENFALTHASCNRVKQASDLRVARILSRFQGIVDEVEKENRSPNLGDILNRYEGSKYDLPVAINETTIKVSFPDIGKNDLPVYPIQLDQLSGFRSAYISLPIQYLHHDDHINPRAIGGNLRKLVEEFHKKYHNFTSRSDGLILPRVRLPRSGFSTDNIRRLLKFCWVRNGCQFESSLTPTVTRC